MLKNNKLKNNKLKNNASTFKNEAEEDENENLKQLVEIIVEEGNRKPHNYIYQPSNASYADLKSVESVIFALNNNENTRNTRKTRN